MVQTVYGSKGEGRISIAQRGLRVPGPRKGQTACPVYARAGGGGKRLINAIGGTVQSLQAAWRRQNLYLTHYSMASDSLQNEPYAGCRRTAANPTVTTRGQHSVRLVKHTPKPVFLASKFHWHHPSDPTLESTLQIPVWLVESRPREGQNQANNSTRSACRRGSQPSCKRDESPCPSLARHDPCRLITSTGRPILDP